MLHIVILTKARPCGNSYNSRTSLKDDPFLAREQMIRVQRSAMKREALVHFDERRQANRTLSREAEERGRLGLPPAKGAPQVDQSLLAFERFMQSPNDVSALKYRHDYLTKVLSKRHK